MMIMSSKAKPVVCPVCGGRGVSNDSVCLFCDGEGFRLGTLGYERTPEAARAEELARIAAFTLLEVARDRSTEEINFWVESLALQLFRTGARRASEVLADLAKGHMVNALGEAAVSEAYARMLRDAVIEKGREMRPSVFSDCNPDRLT